MIKVFELSTETVAFLFQVFEYRGEISHAEILAGHSLRKNRKTPSLLKSSFCGSLRDCRRGNQVLIFFSEADLPLE